MTTTIEIDERGGATVMRDGHPQSYVDLDDPELLVFEYVQHLAIGLDLLPAGPIGVTHIGGAGLTLPRYVQHTRAGSAQIVLEPDEAMTALVRAELPLPRRHRIRVRPQDGATGVAALKDASADAVVVDAYANGRVPADLTDTAAADQYARVLRPGGVALLNLTDSPGLRYVHRVLAGLIGAGLTQVGVLGTHEVLKGKRFGNVVVLASADPLDETTLRRRAAAADFPTGFRSLADLAGSLRSAKPLPPPGAQSPEPPAGGLLRLR
ncbi:spermidine synthase [Dermacoccaceae bacterium W4C1]